MATTTMAAGRGSTLDAAESVDQRVWASWRRARKRERFWRATLPVALAVAVAAAWQLFASSESMMIPTFTTFVASVGAVLVSGSFWQALWTSEIALAIGFGASVLIGIPMGLAMGRTRALEAVIDPYLNIAVIIPMALLMPVILMAFGLNLSGRVAVIFLFGLPFVVVPVRAGALTISRDLWEMCRSYGASEWQIWQELLIPSTVPAMITACRQGLAHALTGMILVELMLLAVGIGKLLLNYEGTYDSGPVFAIVFLLICESVLLMRGVDLLQRFYRGQESDLANLAGEAF